MSMVLGMIQKVGGGGGEQGGKGFVGEGGGFGVAVRGMQAS